METVEKEITDIKNVDMYYRFTWDTEPSDEQLEVIMEGVKQKAIKQSENIKKKLLEGMQEEVVKVKARLDKL